MPQLKEVLRGFTLTEWLISNTDFMSNCCELICFNARKPSILDSFSRIWKDMSLNDSMSDYERSQLAVWDYPVSDKYTKMWQAMQENNPPATFDKAVERVRGDEKDKQDGFAFLGIKV